MVACASNFNTGKVEVEGSVQRKFKLHKILTGKKKRTIREEDGGRWKWKRNIPGGMADYSRIFFKDFCKDFTQARQVASYFTEPCGVCIYSGKHYKKQQFQHIAYIILSHKVKTSHSKRTA